MEFAGEFAGLALLAGLVLWLGRTAVSQPLVVYHTNDLHGQLAALPAASSVAAGEKDPHLLLDSGDFWQGTPEGETEGGIPFLRIMREAGYAAVGVGNHELDRGPAHLRRMAREVGLPLLAANLRGVRGVRPWILLSTGPWRIGVFGILTKDMPVLTFERNLRGLEILDPVRAGQAAVHALKEQGAQIIFAVTHQTLEDDRRLAREVRGIAAIFGGHQHSALEEPVRLENGCLIVRAASHGRSMGRIRFLLSRSGRVLRASWGLTDLREVAREDGEVARQVRRLAEKTSRWADRQIGEAAEPFPRRSGLLDSPLGSWLCDLMQRYAGAEIAFQNKGGIRSDLPAGPLTWRHAFEVSPFGNTVVVLAMKGEQIRKILERSVAETKDPKIGGYTPLEVSGLEVEVDRRRPPGSRIARVLVNGRPLQDDRIYRVATNNFVAQGGDQYPEFLQAIRRRDTGKTLLDLTLEEIRDRSPVRPPPSGRIRVLSDSQTGG